MDVSGDRPLPGLDLGDHHLAYSEPLCQIALGKALGLAKGADYLGGEAGLKLLGPQQLFSGIMNFNAPVADGLADRQAVIGSQEGAQIQAQDVRQRQSPDLRQSQPLPLAVAGHNTGVIGLDDGFHVV